MYIPVLHQQTHRARRLSENVCALDRSIGVPSRSRTSPTHITVISQPIDRRAKEIARTRQDGGSTCRGRDDRGGRRSTGKRLTDATRGEGGGKAVERGQCNHDAVDVHLRLPPCRRRPAGKTRHLGCRTCRCTCCRVLHGRSPAPRWQAVPQDVATQNVPFGFQDRSCIRAEVGTERPSPYRLFRPISVAFPPRTNQPRLCVIQQHLACKRVTSKRVGIRQRNCREVGSRDTRHEIGLFDSFRPRRKVSRLLANDKRQRERHGLLAWTWAMPLAGLGGL